MKKKTYVKPLVSVCAIEALTILAGTTPHPNFPGGGEIENGDNDDVWE